VTGCSGTTRSESERFSFGRNNQLRWLDIRGAPHSLVIRNPTSTGLCRLQLSTDRQDSKRSSFSGGTSERCCL
jgi:hypothetical protein